ncbi:MAG: 50S ribosomal protein L11 methyltransferase [Candidatus Omnitrophica bacterium]|nr:50S ribosomal protein L11 methyltransferase [Candidatus Omnitrophota bacterium]
MPKIISYEFNLIFKKYHPGQSELIRSALINSGVKNEDIVEFDEGMRIAIYVSSNKSAFSLKRTLNILPFKGIEIQVKALKKPDWEEKWKEDFKTFLITPGICIVPYASRGEKMSGKGSKIIIDTASVFGSGLHSTTRLMARLIYEKKGKLNSFLDIGCGTGILSIIAGKLGARSIAAIDINRKAVATAKRNFQLNKVHPGLLKAGDIRNFAKRKRFDFVAANIITDDLIRMKKQIVSFVSPGGILAVSGISCIHHDRFCEEFGSNKLVLLKSIQDKEWLAFLYKKKRI